MTSAQFHVFWRDTVKSYYPRAPILSPGEISAYLDVLHSLPKDKILAGFAHWVKVEKEHWHPGPADLLRAIDEAAGDNFPNADAYKPAKDRKPYVLTDEDYYAAWRQNRLIEMSDEAYLLYLGDIRHDNYSQDARWRQEWEQGRQGRGAA